MLKVPERQSFAKLPFLKEFPDLLEVQLSSYDWFLQKDVPPEQRKVQGLEDVFRSVFPISSSSGEMVLEYGGYEIGEPKYSEEECIEKNLTYSASMKVTFRLLNRRTGEVKEKQVYMGDIPLMTDRATFIINGSQRVVVSQIYKAPGVLFSYKKGEFQGKIVPDKGAWLEFTIDVRKEMVNVRIDSKKKFPATAFLRALRVSDEEIINYFFRLEEVNLVGLDEEEFNKLLIGRRLGKNVYDKSGHVIARAGKSLFPEDVKLIYEERVEKVWLIKREDERRRRIILNTLENDEFNTYEKALAKFYHIVRGGGTGISLETAAREIKRMFFDPKYYDLGKVGRYKILLRLYRDLDEDKWKELEKQRLITREDIFRTIDTLIKVYIGEEPIDDVDHLGNRRVRSVGELLTNQLKAGLAKMEKVISDKLSTEEPDEMSFNTLISIKPISAVLNDFFATSQLSQFMDQTNPLAELTHKRRLSALGPGGLSRERAGFEVRDVHYSHYGRVCPIETPEGPNIGLIVSLATYAKINDLGLIETPYRKVVDGKVTNEIVYLTAIEEEEHYIAQANVPIDDEGRFTEQFVQVRHQGEFILVPPEKVDYMDLSPKQIVSVSTSLIPFLEHDDANRALMGSNMQRQSVPLMITEPPIVGTGMEKVVARGSRVLVIAEESGVVEKVSSDKILIREDNGNLREYKLKKFKRTNQDTCFNQVPLVSEGDRVEKGDIIADGASTSRGELSLGKNVLVAFLSWSGYNYEDAIVISQRLVKDDVFTSIHITEYEVSARETKLGSEQITREIPNVGAEALRNLDENGIVRIGAYVKPGDILVGKVTPKGESAESPEYRLLQSIFGEKAKDVRDTSLRVPPGGGSGVVIDVKVFSRDNGDELPVGVEQLVKVYVAQKRKIKPGDKMAGRHGNKGVISIVLPEEDMPFLPDGTPVDIVLNPLGVPSRMNLGQLYETMLGWAGKILNMYYECPVFEGASLEEIKEELRKAGLPEDGMVLLRDGRTGETFKGKVAVGYMYMMKLIHMVDDKIHARSTGPYSLVTQQPLGGKAQFGGQRLGEMEVWALEAYGAAHTLQEMLTVKSDDIEGRVRVYEGIVKGEYSTTPSVPESFNVLIQELRGLALDVRIYDADGNQIPLTEKDEKMIKLKHLV